MGFFYKTAFWLGLVYYAMPLGRPPDMEARPTAVLCRSARAAVEETLPALSPEFRAAAAMGCAALAARPGPAGSSAQTLNDSDKTPPWRDPARPVPPLPPSRPRTT